ncbi:hypothetical protein QBC38DRAFT_422283 [Podospora fimiseda]|uniref:HMG box domain-containing protein n=1 Tax=Podospora fimiseda TaxID=252190 RepID=A0AAN7BK68_9PEZI|nr:hypothetical protein QBC38DRAFT_422283 [Podospora fimiseda]
MSGGRSAGGAAAATGPVFAPLPSPSSHSSSTQQQQQQQQKQPRGPITRKRAASINIEEANNRQKIPQSLNLGSPSSASPRPFDAGGSQLICLCAPEPKVPRPRNGTFFFAAFILYRQHHQATVVQENPGLANPDISKIIGERWRDESEEVKNTWKQLAEEEKLRHQVQFPGYRYQPRRGNKGGAPSGRPPVAPGEDPSRCPKCGGRYIATPRTPSTPFMTPTAARLALGTPYGPPGTSGQYPPPHPSQVVRTIRPPWGSTAGSLYDIHEDYEGMGSEAKRRRYNSAGGYGNYHPHPMPSSPPPPFVGPPPLGHQIQARQAQIHHPHQQPISRHSSFSGPSTPGYAHPLPSPSSMLARVSPGPSPMPPPPRPGSLSLPPGGHSSYSQQQQSHYPPQPQPQQRSPPHQQPPPPPHRGSIAAIIDFDESLRLPPLQTHLPPTSPGGSSGEPSTSLLPPVSSNQPLTSILYPPPVLPSSHNRDLHAAARSVEAMVMSISHISKLRVLEKISPALPTSSEVRGPIIVIEGPDARLLRVVASIIESGLRQSGSLECEVKIWEDPSIVISSRQGSIASSSGGSGGSAAVSRQSSPPPPSEGFAGYLGTISSWHVKSGEMIKFVTGGQKGEKMKKKLPIALIPSGYSLSLSDRFAVAIPISDSYAPVDHWQWMATLWRGVAGADLVVHVRGGYEGKGNGEEGIVEVRSGGLIDVKVVGDGGGGLDEKSQLGRRLRFEVEEWVRGGGWGVGRGEGMEF